MPWKPFAHAQRMKPLTLALSPKTERGDGPFLRLREVGRGERSARMRMVSRAEKIEPWLSVM
jgi:hypothetical protein